MSAKTISIRSQRATVPLGEVCNLVNGDAYNESMWSTEGVPIIRIQNLNNFAKPFNYWAGPIDDLVVVKDGDVLLAWSGTPGTSFGAHRWHRGLGVLNQHIFRVDFDHSQLDPDWMVFAINEQLNHLIGKAHGAVGLSHVTRRECDGMKIWLPPLSEQRHLASCLKEQEAAVKQARQRVLEQLRHTEILRLKYFRDAFDESALAGWDERSLLDIARIVSGMTLGGPVAKEPTTKVPYLRVANVKDGWLMLGDVKEIDATARDIEQFQLRHGDVVLTEGGDPDKLGRGTVWREELSLCLHQNHIFRVRFDQEQVCPEFAAYQFASKYGKAYFLAHAKQTTGIASINKGVLSRFPFRLPPLETQRRIAARLLEQFEHLQQLKSALTTQLAALDKLPGAYLREAFGSL